MRVIAGSARSLRLVTPDGTDTRPTTDRIKETLFNMLQGYIPDGIFIDVCSGTGGIGIEALSRGAAKAYFFETDKTAIGCIEHNLKHTKLFDKALVFRQDAAAALNYGIREAVDIVFVDAPYGQGYDEQVLISAQRSKAVTEDTIIVIEEKKERDIEDIASDLGFDIIKEKVYKTNKHIFLRRKEK